VLFAGTHLLANDYSSSILFFGTFALLSFFEMIFMDQGRRRETDPKWQIFLNKTSMVPFAALLRGRLRFTLADISQRKFDCRFYPVCLYLLAAWLSEW
jgi:uncharacterized membrane protein